ncbi:hypothetical protein CDL12_27326 [Handroanthus impetiginosus]|uniref:BHLH domain-containing protein n=1 Tax=Handroanthus impetiginosus TaxID=429701 RepID=A0A2G9G4D3_9LAMI|nr:hypothetical protein CDL12_27326 [Handroanthus impetiginosus]
MVSISPQISPLELLENPFTSHHEQENSSNFLINKENILTQTSGSIDEYQYLRDDSPSYDMMIQGQNMEFQSFNYQGEDREGYKMMKKINHNANERDRRKRINSLYSALRSLLPAHEDPSRKLSIPATVSRVVKYIPELQNEVEGLLQKKENLILKINSSFREDGEDLSMNFRAQGQNRKGVQTSLSAISATQISDQEIVVHILMPQVEKGSFCGVITHLEMEGFLVISTSWFESFGGWVFCNLHLQAQGSQVKDAEMLKKKILSFIEKGRRN